MATTPGNRTTFAYGVEPSPNTEPSSTPAAFYGSPNTIPNFGPVPERMTRDPIGPFPGAEAGTVIRTQAPAGYEADLTHQNLLAFLPGLLRCNLSTAPRIFYPTSVRSTDYVVPADGALAENTLIVVRGCATAANNGLKVVGAGSDGTHIVASGLTAESSTDALGVTVEVCGVQGATGDLEIDASGRLKSTTLDFTTLGLEVGQMIWIGGDTTATKFGTATHRGKARITILAAHLITLDNADSGTFPAAAADNGSGKTIQVFFGRSARVRATTHASYTEPTYQLEFGHALLSAGSPAYEYVTGCSVTNGRIALGAVTKALLSVSFSGRGTVDPTASRRTSFSAPVPHVAKTVANTADHIRRGRLRQSTTALTGYLTSMDISIATGHQRQDAHGQQEAIDPAFGDLVITGSARAFFSTMELVPAYRSDTPCNADWFVRCGGSSASDGDTWGFSWDMPAVQITGITREIPAAGSTACQIEFMAVRDTTYSTLAIFSDFPYLPAN